MGRRSDHSRQDLETLILAAAAALVAEVGLAGFSAREVARRIGYSIGTIHNVFGTTDRLVTAINTRSFGLWAAYLRERLDLAGDADRIAVLVEGYFGFARSHTHWWTAIYDHRLPPDATLPEADQQARGVLTEIVITEVARALHRPVDDGIATLARSLIATVHGHCAFAVSGAWALMGEAAPETAALARVREALAGHIAAG
ncbi:TetR family transcriptional regulator [Sphingomonas sp. Leaf17]|uniref:TetR/AcrR family transcriptional regulator n=1 Tax=Sphingomonas sp. Leaf17 TaxID=1735683 RepID=UPI0006F645E5|nr:TetR/AcrR family transcriptional regulator [Sphingomonas sp. Leaf17]KQM67961.1 TetR family transcriptional regulator [Sphingomonas sp. Leaf17]